MSHASDNDMPLICEGVTRGTWVRYMQKLTMNNLDLAVAVSGIAGPFFLHYLRQWTPSIQWPFGC